MERKEGDGIMCNNAWRRLCNEWDANKFNEDLKIYCACKGIDIHADYIDSKVMDDARKFCKANGVWLKDFCEEDMYLDMMPFGGYDGNLDELKMALRKYRKSA